MTVGDSPLLQKDFFFGKKSTRATETWVKSLKHILVATKDFDKAMPMILVWAKNRRTPSVLQDVSKVNMITITLMQTI